MVRVSQTSRWFSDEGGLGDTIYSCSSGMHLLVVERSIIKTKSNFIVWTGKFQRAFWNSSVFVFYSTRISTSALHIALAHSLPIPASSSPKESSKFGQLDSTNYSAHTDRLSCRFQAARAVQ